MATNKSSIITLLEARGTFPTSRISGGPVLEAVAKIEFVVADAIGDIWRLFRLPWNVRITDLHYCCDAITTLTGDLGVYRTIEDGSAVVDVDEFASAIALTSALVVWTDVLGEAVVAAKTLADRAEMELWQVLDEATEPVGRMYDICFTSVGEPGAIGTAAFRIRYVA